jgi:hypothetical protein
VCVAAHGAPADLLPVLCGRWRCGLQLLWGGVTHALVVAPAGHPPAQPPPTITTLLPVLASLLLLLLLLVLVGWLLAALSRTRQRRCGCCVCCQQRCRECATLGAEQRLVQLPAPALHQVAVSCQWCGALSGVLLRVGGG